MKFAENFIDLLNVRGIPQKRFAEMLGVRPSTVNQWAKGKREPSFDYLVRICVLLDIDYNELLGYAHYTRNKKFILRDIIATNPDFRKEQKSLQDRLFHEGKTNVEVSKECEELYLQYYKIYQDCFKFE